MNKRITHYREVTQEEVSSYNMKINAMSECLSLAQYVQLQIDAGWQPYGFPYDYGGSSSCPTRAQTMVKYADD